LEIGRAEVAELALSELRSLKSGRSPRSDHSYDWCPPNQKINSGTSAGKRIRFIEIRRTLRLCLVGMRRIGLFPSQTGRVVTLRRASFLLCFGMLTNPFWAPISGGGDMNDF
jgi:hypothetical protein